MSSRTQSITTIALVAAAGALGAYLWFERDQPTSAELETRKNNLLPAFRREQVSELLLEVAGQRARLVRVVSDGGEATYHLAADASPEPAAEPAADQPAVDRLLQTLEFATPIRKVEQGAQIATGLDSPRAELTLRMGKLSWKIVIGAPASSPEGAAYASVPGLGVFVVGRDVATELLRPIDSYRSRSVLPYVSSDLSAIRLDGAGGPRALLRGSWGGFKLEHGPRVDRVAYDRLLDAFASMRAERFITPELAGQALAAARGASGVVSLVLQPTDTARPAVRVEVGGACPDAVGDGGAPDSGAEQGKLTVAVRSEPHPMAACVPAEVLDALKMLQDVLVDRHMFDVKPDEIEELRIQRAERALELVRKGAGWKLRQPEEREVSAAEGRGLVQGIARLEGEVVSEPDLKALGLEPPGGSIVILLPASGQQERPQQKLELGTTQGEYSYVRRTVDGLVLRVPRAQARVLEPDSIGLRPTQLLELQPERIRKVSVAWGEDKQTVVRSPSGFRLETPAGYVADGAMSADLFDTVAKLTAERWVAERDDGTFGLAAPRVTAQLEAADDGGVKVWRLLIGARATDASYARWEAEPGVFLLPRSVEHTLTAYVIDRSAFIIDPAEVRTMTLTAGGRKEVLTAAGGKLVADPDGGASLAPGAVARIEDALIQMRAEGVVHTGEALADEGFARPLLEVVVQRVSGQPERSKDVRIVIGRGDVWRTVNVYYARRDGISATYALAASRVKPVLSAMGVE
jgi:hypothetical protein